MLPIEFEGIVFKEGRTYVSYCPELDVSSCGNTIDEARKNLKIAVSLFLEEAKNMGTLERAGFKCVRTKGDHSAYTKEGVIRPIIIPDWPEVPVFIIKNNLRSAGISREEYFDLLEGIIKE